MNKRFKIIIGEVCLLLTLILIVMLLTVDVAPIGPKDTSIGFSHLNGGIFGLLGQSSFFTFVTNVLGILAILVAAGFAFLGVMELIQRKSLQKIDSEFYALAGLYVAMGIVYIFFDKIVAVNYRPVIEAGDTLPEASFPSTHTLLACVVFGSAILVLFKFVKNPKNRLIANCVLGCLMALTVIGRLLAGVHWFTDIIGGILISGVLLSVFSLVLDIMKEKRGR